MVRPSRTGKPRLRSSRWPRLRSVWRWERITLKLCVSPENVYLFAVGERSRNTRGSASFPAVWWHGLDAFTQERVCMSFLRRVSSEAADLKQDPRTSDPTFVKEYPALAEYLMATSYDDGTARQTATLLLFVDGDGVKACLNDRETGYSLWSTTNTLTDALTALDDLLQGDNPPWRKNRETPAQNRKKGGK